MRGVLFHMERLQTSRLTLTSLWPCPSGVLWPLALLVVSKILALAPICIWLHLLISNLHFSLIPELSCCCSFPELIRLLVPSEWRALKSPLSFLPLSCRHLLPWLANSQLNHLLIKSWNFAQNSCLKFSFQAGERCTGKNGRRTATDTGSHVLRFTSLPELEESLMT